MTSCLGHTSSGVLNRPHAGRNYWTPLVLLGLSFFSKEIKKDEWEQKPEEQSFCLCWKRIRTLGQELQWLRRMSLQKGNEAPQLAKSNRKLKLKTGYWLHFSVGAAVTGLHVSTDLTLKLGEWNKYPRGKSNILPRALVCNFWVLNYMGPQKEWDVM